MYNLKNILKRWVKHIAKSDLKFNFCQKIYCFQKVKNLLRWNILKQHAVIELSSGSLSFKKKTSKQVKYVQWSKIWCTLAVPHHSIKRNEWQKNGQCAIGLSQSLLFCLSEDKQQKKKMMMFISNDFDNDGGDGGDNHGDNDDDNNIDWL